MEHSKRKDARQRVPELVRLLPCERAATLRRQRAVRELETMISTLQYPSQYPAGHLIESGGLKVVPLIREYARVLTASGFPVSSKTLHNWRRAYRVEGLAGLIDRRWRPARQSIDHRPVGRRAPAFLAELARLWAILGKGKVGGSRLTACYLDAKTTAGRRRWKTCGFSEAKGWLKLRVARCNAGRNEGSKRL